MRRGQDRHELGQIVLDRMFPDGSPFLRGVQLGAELADVSAKEGVEPEIRRDGAVFTYDIEDPLNSGRKLTLELLLIQTRVRALTMRFYSGDKIDVDAPYRLLRKHLNKHHGKPGKELTGVLKFIWQLSGSEFAGNTAVCRYKNDEGIALLEVRTALADGVSLGNPHRKPGLAGSKRASS